MGLIKISAFGQPGSHLETVKKILANQSIIRPNTKTVAQAALPKIKEIAQQGMK